MQVRAWYTTALLLLAYTCSFADRAIINIVVDDLKIDLSLTDTQISLLQGIAFAAVYVVGGLVVAGWSDASSRRRVIVAGLVIWSAMTFGSAFATSFLMLVVLRLGVGMGESALTPAASSMLSDLFPRERLGFAMGVYSIGPFAGGALAMLGGGALLQWLHHSPDALGPLLGGLRPWQVVFLIMGLPGFVLAALMAATVREPMRREPQPRGEAPSFAQVLSYVRQNRGAFIGVYLGISQVSLVSYAASAWLPAYYMRTMHVGPAEAGTAVGLGLAIAGPVGAMLGGLLADRLVRRRIDGTMLVPLLAAPLGAVLLLVSLAASDFTTSAAVLPFAMIMLTMPLGVTMVAINAITPGPMRARTTAFYLLTDALIGLGLGPTLVAVLTDSLFADPAAVGRSIAIVAVAGACVAVAAVGFGLSSYRRTLEALAAPEGSGLGGR